MEPGAFSISLTVEGMATSRDVRGELGLGMIALDDAGHHTDHLKLRSGVGTR